MEGLGGGLESGREALLRRRLFSLKRFDSAEYVLQANKAKYLGEVREVDKYEKKHGLSHERFEPRSPEHTAITQRHSQLRDASWSSPRSPSTSDPEPSSPMPLPASEAQAQAAELAPAAAPEPASTAAAANDQMITGLQLNAATARQMMLERRLFALKRFDSADYQIKARGHAEREYQAELAKTEAYENKHHLSHEHFETHHAETNNPTLLRRSPLRFRADVPDAAMVDASAVTTASAGAGASAGTGASAIAGAGAGASASAGASAGAGAGAGAGASAGASGGANAGAGASAGRAHDMMALDSAAVGRGEMLQRRMFALKRFDSAEHIIARTSGRATASQYQEELAKTEAYEKKHHLSHEHFDTHGAGDGAEAAGLQSKSPPHPLRHEVDPRELAFAAANAQRDQARRGRAGQGSSPGASAAGYFEKVDPRSGASARGSLRESVRGVTSVLEAQAQPPAPSPPSPLPARRASGNTLAQRFLQKKSDRKRWDSGDYNALLSGTRAHTHEPSSPPLPASKPDLDVMSLSSAEGEVKTESVDSAQDAAARVHRRVTGSAGGDAPRAPKPAGAGAATSAPAQAQAQAQAPAQAHDSDDAGLDLAAHSAATQRFLHNQPKSRRFDSADYYRGMGRRAQECEQGGPLQQQAEPSPKGKLGQSTLQQRELHAAKLQRERDFDAI